MVFKGKIEVCTVQQEIVAMTRDDTSGFPARLAEAMFEAGEEAARQPQELAEAAFDQSGSAADFPLARVQDTATFKARVQSGGRINIPDAEREALGIDEEDIVQAVIVPVNSTKSNDQ